MHSTHPRRLSALATIGSIALAASLGLAACAPEPKPSTSSQAAVATETPTPAPEPVAGDVLSPEDAEQINSSWGLATDDKAYQLPTGEWVLIKGNEPLPANVAQAVEVTFIEAYVPAFKSSVHNPDAAQTSWDTRIEQEALTGRKTAIALHAMSALPGGGEEPMWVVIADGVDHQGQDANAAIALAQQWVDQSSNTRILIVVDAVG